jgi:hypothetical protein
VPRYHRQQSFHAAAAAQVWRCVCVPQQRARCSKSSALSQRAPALWALLLLPSCACHSNCIVATVSAALQAPPSSLGTSGDAPRAMPDAPVCCDDCKSLTRAHLPQVPGFGRSTLFRNEGHLCSRLADLLDALDCTDIVQEWHVRGGQSQYGVGDLAATLPCGTEMVVEVKYLDLLATGHTACVKRRKHRRQAEEQAHRYGLLRAAKTGRRVVYAIFDNEQGLKCMGVAGPPSASRAMPLTELASRLAPFRW